MADIDKLISEFGGTVVPEPKEKPANDYAALAAQFGGVMVPGQPITTPGGYGAGTFAKDIGKNVAAGAIPAVLGAPEAVQAATVQQSKAPMTVAEEALNYLASPEKLANKFVTSLGFKPLFDQETKGLVPEELIRKQELALDEVSAKGKAKWAKDLNAYGNKLGQDIKDTLSPEMQLAMANFVPTGSLSDIAHGRVDKLSLGANPTVLGFAGQVSNVFGSAAPGIIGTLTTKDPRYMQAFGFAQAGSEGATNAREYVSSMDDKKLAENSPYFKELLDKGYDPKTARSMTEEKAVDTASAAQGVVGLLGGEFTGNLLTGKFDKALINATRNKLLRYTAQAGKGAVVGGAEEGVQEMFEGIASDLAIDKTVIKEIGQDAFANLVLGAFGGVGPGALGGGKAKPEEEKKEIKDVLSEPPTPTEAAPGTPPGAPKVPGKPTLIDENAYEEETLPAVNPTITPAAPAEVIPEQTIPTVEAALEEKPKPKYTKEEIQARYGKQPATPETEAINVEATKIADELESLGEVPFSQGMRNNITNNKLSKESDLDFYKQKLEEARAKKGAGPQKFEETHNIDKYLDSHKADKKRFDNYIPTAPEPVKAMVAKSNEYLQKLVSRINELGYSFYDVDSTSPLEVQDLKRKISGIAGSTISYAKNAQHIDLNNKWANPDKFEGIGKTLDQDFAESDKLLGKAPAETINTVNGAEKVAEPVQEVEQVKEEAPVEEAPIAEAVAEEPVAEAPVEEHVEPNKTEALTSKTIEESIDKAETKVDYKKIKQAVKNQFDQAIKRTTIMTEKEFAAKKGMKDEEKFVTIDVPGDGKFKVKNNKERLEVLQKRMMNAVVPKAAGVKARAPNAASQSAPDVAFKNLLDSGDIEAAVEYGKLKKINLDPAAKEIQLDAKQRKTLETFFGSKEAYQAYKDEVTGTKAKENAAKVADEGTFYNNFDSNFNKADLAASTFQVRDDKISELAGISRRITASIKKVANQGSDLAIQARLNYLMEYKEQLRNAIDATKPERRSAEWFRARAAEEVAKENLSPETMAVVDALFAKYPNILEGLKLSVKSPKQKGVTGNFRPIERLVTVYHSSLSSLFSGNAGERQAATMRHEITHSLEQMMTPDAQKALVNAWADALERAIKANPGEAEQAYFQAVLDFTEKPNEANYKKAISLMPEYDFYQYMNPSEFWAVNAEKLMKATLGTPWARFVKGVQKLWEAIKNVMGFNNRYAIHREFDRIMKGDQQQMTETMLADYLRQNKEEMTFLNNVEDTDELLDRYNRPKTPLHIEPNLLNRLIGGTKAAKEATENAVKNPTGTVVNMGSSMGNVVLKQRIKNINFLAGLEERDRIKHEGKLRTSEDEAIATVAAVNALHSGHIGTQVMLLGKLAYDKSTQMFHAVKDKHSLANVLKIKQKLEKRIGAQRAADVIQAYFEAKRSRSIENEYYARSGQLEELLQKQQNPATSQEDQVKLIAEIEEAQESMKGIEIARQKIGMRTEDNEIDDDQIDEFIALEDTYSELREMMDNWTSVYQNSIEMMQFSGLISKKRAETLMGIKDYVPWFRIQDSDKDIHSGTGGGKSLTNVGREKRFKAGQVDMEIDNVVENMIRNTLTLTRNSMRNFAANRIVMEYGERKDNGKLKVYPKEDRENGIFNILANGRRINVRIADPMVAEAAMGLENVMLPMNEIMAAMSNFLRRSVTWNPVFQFKQAFMDAPTAALISGVKNPVALYGKVFGSFIRALVDKNDPIVQTLKSYGIGGYKTNSRSPEYDLKQEIGIINKSNWSRFTKFLDHIGDASDYSQRVAVYKQVLKETGDQLQAIYQANNIIDFQKKGSGATAQFLTRQVAFMNAYAQQIDVLAQALSGKGLKGLKRQQAFTRLVSTGVLMAGTVLLYAMAIGDDDEYQQLDDQTKMRNFYIPKKLTKAIGMDQGILIPLTTSAAFFYKAVPEMLYNKIMNEGTKNQVDNTRLRNALAKAAVDSLTGPTPVPTGIKPFVEVGFNHNFMTGNSLTPRGMEKLNASRQFTAATSELGKVISALTSIPGTDKRLLNPIEADHIMRGLTGTVGSAAMWGSNLLSGKRPEADAHSNPLYGAFVAPKNARGREDLFYDLQEASDEAYETFKDLMRKGHQEEGKQWFEEHKGLITANGFTTSAGKSLQSLNGEIRRLTDLPESQMSAKEKTERIDFYKKKKNDVLEQTIKFRLKAGL